MKNIQTISLSLIVLAASLAAGCGGGRNYLALRGKQCEINYQIEVEPEVHASKKLDFDNLDLPIGLYEYVGSSYFIKEKNTDNPLSILVTETKKIDKKSGEFVYEAVTGCIRNVTPGATFSFNTQGISDMVVADTAGGKVTDIDSRQIAITYGSQPNDAVKIQIVPEENNTAQSPKAYYPADTKINMYRIQPTVYELRTETEFPNYTVSSLVTMLYIPTDVANPSERKRVLDKMSDLVTKRTQEKSEKPITP